VPGPTDHHIHLAPTQYNSQQQRPVFHPTHQQCNNQQVPFRPQFANTHITFPSTATFSDMAVMAQVPLSKDKLQNIMMVSLILNLKFFYSKSDFGVMQQITNRNAHSIYSNIIVQILPR
jgi:hypothetical protein